MIGFSRKASVAAALAVGWCVFAWGSDTKTASIKKDRWQIEGTWRVVSLVVNGNPADEDACKKMSVMNGADGSWTLISEGNEISKGTTTIDPTIKPGAIDISPTEGGGKGDRWQGIYELGENTRKLCFAAHGRPRPTEFASAAGSELILLTFERDPVAAAKIDRKRFEGVWKAVALEIDGNKADDSDARRIGVVFGIDGSWSVNLENKDHEQGTSQIDPIQSPKTIDFTPTTGDDKGKQTLGIYEISEDSLKVCVTKNGLPRPTDFSAPFGGQRIMIYFERAKTH